MDALWSRRLRHRAFAGTAPMVSRMFSVAPSAPRPERKGSRSNAGHLSTSGPASVKRLPARAPTPSQPQSRCQLRDELIRQRLALDPATPPRIHLACCSRMSYARALRRTEDGCRRPSPPPLSRAPSLTPPAGIHAPALHFFLQRPFQDSAQVLVACILLPPNSRRVECPRLRIPCFLLHGRARGLPFLFLLVAQQQQIDPH